MSADRHFRLEKSGFKVFSDGEKKGKEREKKGGRVSSPVVGRGRRQRLVMRNHGLEGGK